MLLKLGARLSAGLMARLTTNVLYSRSKKTCIKRSFAREASRSTCTPGLAGIDALGNVTRYAYNDRNWLTSVTAPGGRALTLAYDGSNRISTLSGPAGLIATYTYDASSRLQQVQYADEAASGDARLRPW